MERENEIILQAVAKAIDYRSNFVAYRMPEGTHLHFGAQIIDSHIPVGFYVQPFIETADSPKAYISAQFDARKYLLLKLNRINGKEIINSTTTREQYNTTVQSSIKMLKEGKMSKVVISKAITGKSSKKWVEIYREMLMAYPNAFVFVFNSEDTGFWMGASPENFLSFHNGNLKTMALAGTRPANSEEEWSDKNVNEQQIVVDYIKEKYEEIKSNFTEGNRYTKKAGNVEHLCTEFSASINNLSQVEKLSSLMHPTPALAGIPRNEAIKHIIKTENHSRRYDGGYIGPIDAKGNFDFFVNLRSIEFSNLDYCIYAGGGITAASDVDCEWEETENKVAPLLKILEDEQFNYKS